MSRAENRSEGECLFFFEEEPANTFRQHSKLLPNPHVLNGSVQDAFSHQIMTFSVIFYIILVMQLILIYLYVENDLSGHPSAILYLQFSSVCPFLACGLLSVKFYSQKNEYQHIGHYLESILEVILKAVALLFSPYDFLEGNTLYSPSINAQETVEQIKTNHLLAIITFFKAACFAGVLLSYSKYMHPRATRISRLYGKGSGVAFALKSIFKDAPFRFIIVAYSFSFVLFTFAFRVSEASIYSGSSSGTIYCNMAWMTMMTMTTVGYGEFVPKTTIGQWIGAGCCIWGAFIVSVMVVVLTSAFSMDRKESQALKIAKKLEKDDELRAIAANVIQKGLKRLWTGYKYKLRLRPRLEQRKMYRQFRYLRQEQKLYSQRNDYKDCLKKMEGAIHSVSNLTQNNLKLINLLTEWVIFGPLPTRKPKQSHIQMKQQRK